MARHCRRVFSWAVPLALPEPGYFPLSPRYPPSGPREILKLRLSTLFMPPGWEIRPKGNYQNMKFYQNNSILERDPEPVDYSHE